VLREINPQKSNKVKKKLVLTNRIKRIRLLSYILILVGVLNLFIISHLTLNALHTLLLIGIASIVMMQILPIFIVLSNYLLSFNEKRLQNYFLTDAKRILQKYKPYTIGITGSYGKTSTKVILHEILNQTLGPTISPVKSINTLMGVTAYIRNNLKLFHKYAIIEMGAYSTGSISKLCDLIPPDSGIVTRVGIMHLERYGTVEKIFQAKSELPQAIPSNGIIVCNGDDPYCRKMVKNHSKKVTLLYGYDNTKRDLDTWLDNITYTKNGSKFNIHFQGNIYEVNCKILGKPLLSNILAAFTLACALGADPNHVISVIDNLEPYDNRLQLVIREDYYELRDAYNSNPDGFKAALDVLENLDGTNKILVTPGMVELGNMQFEENKKVAEYAAKICDYIFVVGDTNSKAFLEGLKTANFEMSKALFIPLMKDALIKVMELKVKNDIILIENDLLDIYEKIIKL
jgi:UDP-N-acetylmuramoyl-tripeptide--D-alanyl-D-alanine ligase